MMQIRQAQDAISRSFVGGGPGVVYSGLIWIVAGFVHLRSDVNTAFIVLFIGGMTIFPASILLSRILFRRPNLSSGNPLGTLGLESTIAMLAGLFAAWLFLPLESSYVLPLAAIAVGVHYFAFATLYGDKIYWLLAALITAAGFSGIYAPDAIPGGTLFAIGIIELTFGLVLSKRALKR
jgi:hypothetical protein